MRIPHGPYMKRIPSPTRMHRYVAKVNRLAYILDMCKEHMFKEAYDDAMDLLRATKSKLRDGFEPMADDASYLSRFVTKLEKLVDEDCKRSGEANPLMSRESLPVHEELQYRSDAHIHLGGWKNTKRGDDT